MVQPIDQLIWLGSNATFTVTAISTNAVIAYQWQFNRTNIAGATNNFLAITNAQPSDVGEYRVVVSDAIGSQTSQVARLQFIMGPSILDQAHDQTVFTGEPAIFRVRVAGTQPLGFSWALNGATVVPFSSATESKCGMEPHAITTSKLVLIVSSNFLISPT